MSDLMPPPVSSPQAPAKATAKTVAGKPGSESNQEFSKVLGKRMEADTGSRTAPEADKSQRDEAAAGDTDAAGDGKQLPPGGNAEALLALLDADGEPIVTAGLDAPVGDEPAGAEILNPALIQTTISIGTQQPAGSAAPVASPMQAQPGNPSLVAQAMQEALADQDAKLARDVAMERLGAEMRNLNAASQRPAGFEQLLERTALMANQTQTNAVAQTLPGGLAADAAATARPVAPTTTVETPFRQPGWDQALSERVLWAANQKMQSAEIKLNPPQLGPIEVRIQMHQDQAQVSFTSQHAAVRDALEAALPRLREMFNASGFELDANVSQHSFAQQQRQAQGFSAGHSAVAAGPDEGVPVAVTQELGPLGALSRGGVDLFV